MIPLPRLLVLTDRTQAARPLATTVAACVAGGARAVVLREKDLPRDERARLAERLRAVLAEVDGTLLVASDDSIPAHGVHLAAADPMVNAPIVGRSCHTRDELADAAADGCTYATLSPIFPTRSKPGHGPALTPTALADPPLPTVALGGVDRPDRAADCMRAGAFGVAVMGAVMRAQRPDQVVTRLLDSMAAAGKRDRTAS